MRKMKENAFIIHSQILKEIRCFILHCTKLEFHSTEYVCARWKSFKLCYFSPHPGHQFYWRKFNIRFMTNTPGHLHELRCVRWKQQMLNAVQLIIPRRDPVKCYELGAARRNGWTGDSTPDSAPGPTHFHVQPGEALSQRSYQHQLPHAKHFHCTSCRRWALSELYTFGKTLNGSVRLCFLIIRGYAHR